jgi:hypothetical protein
MIAVQMRDEDGRDSVGVDASSAQRHHGGGAAVYQE